MTMKFAKFVIVAVLLACFSVKAQVPQGEARLPGEEEVFSAPPPPEEKAPPPAAVGEVPDGEQKPVEEQKPAAAEEELVYLNVNDQDIKEVIKQISKATNRNFIIDSKVSGKVTILSNKMMSKEEAYQAFLSALQVAGFTTVSGPGGVLKIIPLRDAKNFPIPTHVDTTPYTDSYITRLIKLDSISANDMAEAIKGLISKDGNLFAYPETNPLVLTDSGTNIDRLMKIIKELDQEGPQQVLEIIPIHYAAAKDIATMVLSLFEEQKKAAGGRPGAGGGLEEMAQVSKIIADERTNSLIVLASKRSIDKVKELIGRLDAKLEEGAEGRIHVHYLKYAKAKDITSVLQNLAGQASKPGAATGPGQSTIIAELEDFKVAADDPTNSLPITSNLKTYNTLVDKVLSKIDIPRKQVYLEAMVIEFFLSRKKQFGVSGSGGAIFGQTLGFGETFQQMTGLFDPFNPANTGSAFMNAPGLLGGILSRRTVDIKVPKPDGTTQTVSVPAFSAFVTALDIFGDTNIVASPNLLALDNEESTIEILRKEPEPGQVNITGTGITQQGPPQRVDAGLTLKLTPQITEGGSVRMKIDQKYSTFSTAKDASLKAQAIVERKIQTSVITNDGQTVVLGGLMEDQVRMDVNKIPVLGDIPLLGYLFQKKSTDKNKSNLLLFVTPHIIRDSGDFETVLYRKMGEQRDFLNKNFKKKQRDDLTATITSHNKDLLDILDKKPGSAVSPPASSAPPVITAKSEEEPHVTLILPPTAKLPETAPAAPAVTTKTTTTTTVTPTPMEIIPPRKPKPEASAKPAPPPASTTTTTTTKRAPVIIMPQGSSPDLAE